MRFKATEVLRGISNIEYNIDGEKVLSLAAHIDVPLDPEKGGKGCRTEPMRCADPSVVEAIAHNPFPFVAELELEQRAGKKQGQVALVVLSIRPLDVKPGEGKQPSKG